MLRKFALIAALGPVLWLSTAYALSLGDIDVQSRLNQRFSAVIPLSAIDAEDADSIQVQLGSNDDFAKAGIERADYLSSLTFQVKTDGKNPRVVISSNLIAHDPFLNFLLEVRSQGTRLLRQYTVLLDPPNYAEPSVPIAANAAPAESAAPEAAQGNPPAQSAPASPAAGVTGEENPAAAPVHTQYGPVKPGETLWSIAAKLRSDPSITMNQVLLAIYNSNRRAFEPRLEVRKGSMLEVPTLDQMRSVSAVEATQRVERLSGKHAHAQKPRSRAQRHVKPAKAAEAAAPAPAPASAPVPAQAAPGPSAENKPDTGMQVQNQPAPAPAVESTKPVSAPEPTKLAAETGKPKTVEAPAPASSLPGSVPTEPAAAPAAATPAQAENPPPVVTTPANAEPVPVPVPAAPVKPAVQPSAPPSPPPESLMDTLMPWGAGVVVLLLGLLGLRLARSKRSANSMDDRPTAKKRDWRFWKKDKPVAPAAAPATLGSMRVPKAPAVATAVAVATAATAAKARLGDTLQAAPAAPARTPQFEQTLEQTAQLPNFDSTQTVEAPVSKPSSKNIDTDSVDFDVTGKFEAETLKVDLSADDPLSEADFHLAYGLYDEAALLLKKAIAKDPKRKDLSVKLAETYFRAGKALEFTETAEPLKAQLPAAEWQKLAIMGQQLNPDADLFKTAGATAAIAGVMDLAFDEPEATAAIAPPSTGKKPFASDSGLDFKLEDFDAPHVAEPVKPVAAAAATSSDNTLEFNLTDFDLSPAGAKAATHDAPAAKTPTIDEIKLENFDLGDASEDSHAISAGDEAGTKLDLARAYVDMGDNETARTLLNEVMEQGSATQKTDAETLLKRLA